MKIEDYNKYYIQGSDHYLIPKYEFREIFRKIEKLKDENRHLNIQLDRALEDLDQQVKKQKEVIDKLEKYIEKETRIYGLSMSIELGTHFDNISDILKEVE